MGQRLSRQSKWHITSTIHSKLHNTWNTHSECRRLVADAFVTEEEPQDVFVVAELDVSPVDVFLLIDRLLRRHDERVEEVLKLLVRHVDT